MAHARLIAGKQKKKREENCQKSKETRKNKKNILRKVDVKKKVKKGSIMHEQDAQEKQNKIKRTAAVRLDRSAKLGQKQIPDTPFTQHESMGQINIKTEHPKPNEIQNWSQKSRLSNWVCNCDVIDPQSA